MLQRVQERQRRRVERLGADERVERPVGVEVRGGQLGRVPPRAVRDEHPVATGDVRLGDEAPAGDATGGDAVGRDPGDHGVTALVVVGQVRQADQRRARGTRQHDRRDDRTPATDEVQRRLLGEEPQLVELHQTAVVAPVAAEPTVRAYFASTPRV